MFRQNIPRTSTAGEVAMHFIASAINYINKYIYTVLFTFIARRLHFQFRISF